MTCLEFLRLPSQLESRAYIERMPEIKKKKLSKKQRYLLGHPYCCFVVEVMFSENTYGHVPPEGLLP